MRAQRTARAQPARTQFAFVPSPPARPEARAPAAARAVTLYEPPAPKRPATPPASLFAIGGKPSRGLIPQGQGMPLPPDQAAVSAYTHAKQFEAQTSAIIAELFARDKDKERRIAALEAEAADRRAQAVNMAQALFGIARSVVASR
jgi:hypothetical protein